MNITKIGEHDRKVDNDERLQGELDHIRSSSIIYFCRCGIIFIFFTFGQIQSFSVKFNKLTFLIVIFRSSSNS